MAKASDNVFPKVILGVQTSAPTAPSDGSWKVFSKADGVYAESSNTTVGPFLGTSGVSGALSIGSNAMSVGATSQPGTSGLFLYSDHRHQGILSVTSSSSNTLQRPLVNFRAGANIGLTASDTDGDGALDTITISGAAAAGGGSSLTVQDEGSNLATAATTLNFVGSGVVASGTGATKTITIAGGAASGNYLDTYADPIDGTMGDEFDGAALNGRWSRRNISAGWESYQQGNGSWLKTHIQSGTQVQQYYQSFSSTDFEFIASFSLEGQPSGRMFGLCVFSSGSTAGRGIAFYTDNSVYGCTLDSTRNYTSNFGAVGTSYATMSGVKTWARIRRTSGTFYSSFSLDGQVWGREVSVSDSVTYDEVLFGRIFGTNNPGDVMSIDKFDRVA